MSGYCGDCGNTLCVCPPAVTYGEREAIPLRPSQLDRDDPTPHPSGSPWAGQGGPFGPATPAPRTCRMCLLLADLDEHQRAEIRRLQEALLED